MLPRQHPSTKGKVIPMGKRITDPKRIRTLTDPIIKGLKPAAASFEIADAVVPGLSSACSLPASRASPCMPARPASPSHGWRSPATARSRLPTFAISRANGWRRSAKAAIRRPARSASASIDQAAHKDLRHCRRRLSSDDHCGGTAPPKVRQISTRTAAGARRPGHRRSGRGRSHRHHREDRGGRLRSRAGRLRDKEKAAASTPRRPGAGNGARRLRASRASVRLCGRLRRLWPADLAAGAYQKGKEISGRRRRPRRAFTEEWEIEAFWRATRHMSSRKSNSGNSHANRRAPPKLLEASWGEFDLEGREASLENSQSAHEAEPRSYRAATNLCSRSSRDSRRAKRALRFSYSFGERPWRYGGKYKGLQQGGFGRAGKIGKTFEPWVNYDLRHTLGMSGCCHRSGPIGKRSNCYSPISCQA